LRTDGTVSCLVFVNKFTKCLCQNTAELLIAGLTNVSCRLGRKS